MQCPKCGQKMLERETLSWDLNKLVRFYTCNNLKCEYDEEIVLRPRRTGKTRR